MNLAIRKFFGSKKCRRRRPGPGEVLVRIHAIGVNPVETYIRAGTYARLPELPYTPGNDGAGVVEQVGADVSEFKAGDRIYTAGSLSRNVCRVRVVQNGASTSVAGKCFVRARRGDRARRTRRRIAGCCSAPTRSQVKRCWCTARAAVWGLQRCNWRALMVCACSERRAATKDSSSHANKVRTKCSIIARLIILSR